MAEIFLHGLETEEKDAGNPRYVATIDSAIIFIVGTAPGASIELYPYNQPKLLLGYNDYPQGLGSTGTLPDQLDLIMKQSGRSSPTIVFNRVEEGGTPGETLANVLGSRSARTGLHALSRVQSDLGVRPKILIAPGFTSLRPTNGVTEVPVTTGGTGYDPANPPAVTFTRNVSDTTGVGAYGVAVVNELTGAIDEIVMVSGGTSYTAAPTVAIAAAPSGGTNATLGTVTVGQVANPVASELSALANRYRATFIVSGPNTNKEAAVTYRMDFDTDRGYMIDPNGMFSKGGVPMAMPAEGAMAGLQARIDYEEGFWVSPSNHVIQGLLGVSRPIEHSLSDRSSESQYLNRNHIGTLVQSPTGGWKLFGNRVMKADSLHVFWSRRRAHDVIIESVEIACEPFLDKPLSKQHLIDIAETVNRALRRWEGMGATLGGRVWLDPVLNTAESMSNGILYIHYDGEAPAPMEHIVFVFNRNTGYYQTMFENAAREIARMSSLAVSA